MPAREVTAAITARRTFFARIGALALTAPSIVRSQQPAKVHRIGLILTGAPLQVVHLVRALDGGLRDLGYVEGRNLVLERRYAEGDVKRLPQLAADLAGLDVEVIVTGSNPVIAAVKQATATIPVVMAVSRDPVGAGFIASLAKPGGNITGLANDPTPDIVGKTLELLKEAVPSISRVALLWNPVPPGAAAYHDAVERVSRRLGTAFQSVEVRTRGDFEPAFAALRRERANGVVVATDPTLSINRNELVRLALANRLPAVSGLREFTEAGGLMSYGPNIAYQFRRAAFYVDRILKGAHPADLPVEQPTKFELVINLKTARALGIAMPQPLLLRADDVIE